MRVGPLITTVEAGIPWEDCPVEVGKLYRYSNLPVVLFPIFREAEGFSFLHADELVFFALENTFSRLSFHDPISGTPVTRLGHERLLAVRCLMGEMECFLCFEGSQTSCPGVFTKVTDDDL